MKGAPILIMGLALLLSAPHAYSSDKPSDADIAKVSWQYSSDAPVRLQIRDKNGTLGSYQATFHVISPKNTEYTCTITVHGTTHGVVTFPDDFGSEALVNTPTPGVYHWFATVADKKVISGQFEFISNSKYYYGVHFPYP